MLRNGLAPSGRSRSNCRPSSETQDHPIGSLFFRRRGVEEVVLFDRYGSSAVRCWRDGGRARMRLPRRGLAREKVGHDAAEHIRTLLHDERAALNRNALSSAEERGDLGLPLCERSSRPIH